ncbi:roundabout homolog 4 isoform X2 [Protopterus annectens]|uniref:roundabout homolog 4 isoform X2 n=1 Tax=Protopterus annectens TaxID=7888 RepID=UPI001CF96923|nr:roundabout homolog 4 isoform X2 [Protopterus annectens]
MFLTFFLLSLALFAQCEATHCPCPPDKVAGGQQASLHPTRHLHHHRHKRGQRFRGFKTHLDEFPPRIIDHPSDSAVPRNHPVTLRCRAEGKPEPLIEWYHNGEHVQTNRADTNLHRMLLPDWSLFFLSLNLRKGSSDEGVYYCVARNQLGIAVSKNASLYIEALKDEFRLEPNDVIVTVGEQVMMECLPPNGHPDPVVTWKKDGIPVTENGGRYVISDTKLLIPSVQKSDAGVVICVASNQVGQRESRGARISVLEKPVITLKPSSMTVKRNSTVQFDCGTYGDPLPVVSWQREDGKMPLGRYEITSQTTLQIHFVTKDDSGRYTCTAKNQAGIANATVTLTVQDDLDTGQRQHQKQQETLSDMQILLENVTALSSSSAAYLRWKVISISSGVEGYIVFYRSILPAGVDWMEWIHPKASEYSTVVPTLKRGYKYEFKVRPYMGQTYGPESNLQHLQIPEEVPSAAPQSVNVAVAENGNGTVVISWEAPPHDSHNGIIKGYKVWCVTNSTQYSANWTIDGGTHHVKISTLASGIQYIVQVAAFNGAGVGVRSLPKELYIKPHVDLPVFASPPQVHIVEQLLEVVQQPVFIASVGMLLWIVLMISAVAVCQHHSKQSDVKRKRSLRDELFRIASEDMIIKHRMNIEESPWLSNSWNSSSFSKHLRGSLSSSSTQPLWANTKENPGFQKSTLSFDRKRQCFQGQSIPVVPDASLYGTLYVDLPGRTMKTFGNHRAATTLTEDSKLSVPLGYPDPSPMLSSKSSNVNTVICSDDEDQIPWKAKSSGQITSTDLWDQIGKKVLQPMHSVPLQSGGSHFHRTGSILGVRALGAYQNRGEHGAYQKTGNNFPGMKTSSSPKAVHYSTSLKLIDVPLPPPPPPPLMEEEDTQSVGTPEGSTKSTKLTADSGPADVDISSPNVKPADKEEPSYPTLTYSRLSTASLSLSMNEDCMNVMSSDEVAKYLELSDDEDGNQESSLRHLNGSKSSSPSRQFSPPHTYGYICGPMPSDLETDPAVEDDDLEMEEHYISSRHFFRKYCQTPTSSLSECDSSLANGWGSVSEDNVTSARSSMVSSSDGSFLMDAHFAQALAVAVDSFCFGLTQVDSEKTYTDFSSVTSPLATICKSPEYQERPRKNTKKEQKHPLPVLEWTADWLEQMEARYAQQKNAKASVQIHSNKDNEGQLNKWTQQHFHQMSQDRRNFQTICHSELELNSNQQPFTAEEEINFTVRKEVERSRSRNPPVNTSRLTVVKV